MAEAEPLPEVHHPVLTEHYTDWTCAEGVREYIQNWHDVAATNVTDGAKLSFAHRRTRMGDYFYVLSPPTR